MSTTEERSEAHFWRTVLPSRTATYLARRVMGREYKVYPWIAYMEREVVEMLQRPGREVLIISVPPQQGKTTYIGMWLPFWYLGHNPDHLVMFLTYNDEYCLGPETPVLTEALEYVPVGSLEVGDRLVAFDEMPGLEGHGRARTRRWRTGEVTATRRVLLPSYRVMLADGTETVASEDHLWLVASPTAKLSRWATTKELFERQKWLHPMPCAVKLLEAWEPSESRAAGYVAGMFDGEGWVRRSNRKLGLSVSCAQSENPALDEMERCLKGLGFAYSNTHQGAGVRRIEILGGRPEALRFLGTVRPHRLLSNWLKMGGAETLGMASRLDRVPVLDVEFLGAQEVVALGTTTGTLVADGFAHHNSATWSVRVRGLVSNFGKELFGLGLNPAQHNISNWRTSRGFGGMLAAGIGGGITGNPGQLILVDDVIKNMEEAGSPTTKRKHLDEWDGAISARFQEDTKVVITATRWAEDDLSGEIYARTLAAEYEGIPVRQIRIKAIAEPDEDEELAMSPAQLVEWRDFLGRAKGEHLTGQHSAKFFHEKRASVSPYVWSALYQASPSARKGSMFPLANWGFYDPDDRCNMAALRRVWDIAATEGGGDWTVGSLVGKGTDGYIYVLDVRRFQKSTSGVKKEIMRIARADGRSIPIRMEKERAGAGLTTIENYAEDLVGYDFEGIRAEGEKVSRFMPYADLQQTGRVRLPRRRDGTSPEWVQPFVDEHKMQMPDGRGPRHDDQIDTVAYAVNELYGTGPVELLDPGDYNTDGYEQILDIAADHNVMISPEMPARLEQILGR